MFKNKFPNLYSVQCTLITHTKVKALYNYALNIALVFL